MTAYLVRMRSGCEGGGKGALVQTEKSGTLATNNDQTLFVIENKCYRISSDASNAMKSSNPKSGIKETDLSPTLDTTIPTPSKSQGGLCIVQTKVYENHAQDARYEEKETCPTITSRYGTGGGNVPLTLFNAHSQDARYKEDSVANNLTASMDNQTDVPLTIFRQGDFGRYKENDEGKAQTLAARGGPAGIGGSENLITFGKVSRPKGKDGLGERWSEVKIASTRNCMDIGDSRAQEAVVMHSQVRRLTPVECERLMGFPDGYTDFKEKTPDGPRYKALGNSWAVPVVKWIGKRIDAAVRSDCTNDEVLKKEA